MIGLLHAEESMMMSLSVSIQDRNVTDRQIDRQTGVHNCCINTARQHAVMTSDKSS